MPRGNWGILAAALFGLIIFAGVSGYSIAPSREADGDYQQTVGSEGRAQQRRYQPQQADIDRAGLPGFAERAISNPQPQAGTDQEKRDLAAQEATAAFTFWMVIVALVQALVAFIGIVYIRRTIAQGQQALAHARLSAKTEQRAWVKFEIKARFGPTVRQDGGRSLRFEGTAMNIGNTPALSVNTWSSLYFADPAEALAKEIEAVKSTPLPWAGTTIFPGDDYPLSFSTEIDEQRRSAAGPQAGQGGVIVETEDRSLVYLVFLAQYRTVYDATLHHTAVVYRIEPGIETTRAVNFLRHYGDNELACRRHEDGTSYVD